MIASIFRGERWFANFTSTREGGLKILDLPAQVRNELVSPPARALKRA